MSESIPPDVSEQERWICHNHVESVRAEYRQTGTDTAESYVHLKPVTGKAVCWLESTFRKVARLEFGTGTVAQPGYGVCERVKAREAWEKSNAKELAEYKRLKAKFEGAPHG